MLLSCVIKLDPSSRPWWHNAIWIRWPHHPMGRLLVIINLHINRSVITCPFSADEGCKKAKPKWNPGGGGMPSLHIWLFLTDAQPRFCCLSAQKRKRDAEKKKAGARLRPCAPLPNAPNHVGKKEGKSSADPGPLRTFTKFSAISSSLVSQLHPTCNKRVQRADALTQQPHAFICRSTRTGTDFP